jgi:hypothetical protein
MSQYARAVKSRRYEEAITCLSEAGLSKDAAWQFLLDSVTERAVRPPAERAALEPEQAAELTRLEEQAALVRLRRRSA